MGQKTYVLVYGDPSERCVAGVFSTREAAEAGFRFEDELSTVPEFDVDAPLPEGPEGRFYGTCTRMPAFRSSPATVCRLSSRTTRSTR